MHTNIIFVYLLAILTLLRDATTNAMTEVHLKRINELHHLIYLSSNDYLNKNNTLNNPHPFIHLIIEKFNKLKIIEDGELYITSDKTVNLRGKKKHSTNSTKHKRKNCIISTKLRPVCASDGQTYANKDIMKCENASLYVSTNGQCYKSNDNLRRCKVSSENAPVCASDGHTYQNEDVVKCKDAMLNVIYKGKCNKRKSKNCRIRNNLYKPVCATDGRTYPNEEFVKCRNISTLKIHRIGKCKVISDNTIWNCKFSLVNKPVCATNGETYYNSEVMKCEHPSLQVAKQGICNSESRRCPFNLMVAPVCGSDGKTYDNDQLLVCADPSISFVSDGKCENNRQSEYYRCKIRNNKYKPVCGSDWRTYPNEDFVKCRNITPLDITKKGKCQDIDYGCQFSIIEDPVCASNGKTYFNSDIMKCEDPLLTIVKRGICERDVRPYCWNDENIKKSVCASNGKTYRNEFDLSCDDPTFKFVSYGRCDKHSKNKKVNCSIRDNKYNPICGSDGRTYPNEDFIKCRNISVLRVRYKGKCLFG